MARVSCFLCLILPFLLLLPAMAQTHGNKTLGSFLTAKKDGSSWTSPSGEFAFGFQQIGTGFLLAIWFDRISERTIVWSANGESLVQEGSRIELTTDGQFLLTDTEGKQVWNAVIIGTGVAYAAMLDSGNFVLANQESVNLWESFKQPTDTILPTQTFNQGDTLFARYSETNYSKGRFMFTLQSDGNLVLATTDFPLDSANTKYWSTETVGSGFRVIFNQSGFLYLTARNGSILNFLTSNGASTSNFYQMAILEYDGVLRQYIYPKSVSSSGGRPMAWSTLSSPTPSDICTSIRQATGSGACGFNSYCVMEDNQRPSCKCPPGYTYMDSNNEMNGCKQDFVSQDCDAGQEEINLYTLRDMPNTDWPESDYEHFQPVTEDWCRQACLNDCFCAVAIFRNADCWKKKFPLSNGKSDPGVGGKALIKIRKANSTLISTDLGPKDKQNSTLIIVGSVLLSSSAFLNILLLVAATVFFFRVNRKKTRMLQADSTIDGTSLRSFTYKELEDATNGFKEELGRGAYATVYKGVIESNQKKIVAVKKLDKMVKDGEEEFRAEVNSIGRTNHKNLVQLLGFCNEGQHRLLVYEYMRNGSLANFLFGQPKPNWYKRVHIAFGTARGLAYLHEDCNTQIIHCDIKPENILIDDSLTARISDFGLAKLLRTDQTRTMTGIRGTRGYVAPEWFKSMPVTAKVDVYSFGILLFELIFCRKNFDQNAQEEDQMVLADWACDNYRERKLELMIENDEEAIQDIKRVGKFMIIAIWCIQEDPSMRPTMKKVAQMLEGTAEVPSPPDPYSFISSV